MKLQFYWPANQVLADTKQCQYFLKVGDLSELHIYQNKWKKIIPSPPKNVISVDTCTYDAITWYYLKTFKVININANPVSPNKYTTEFRIKICSDWLVHIAKYWLAHGVAEANVIVCFFSKYFIISGIQYMTTPYLWIVITLFEFFFNSRM